MLLSFEGAQLDITKEEILSKVSQLTIFTTYCKNFEELDRSFTSEFYHDTNPSCRIYIGSNNIPYYKDFGSGEHLDCFAYVQKKYNVNFYECLRIIANDFKIKNLSVNIDPKIIIPRESINVPVKPRVKSKIEIFPQNYNLRDYNYWNQFKIPLQLLEDYDVFSCKWVYLIKGENKTVFEYSRSNPIYAYRFTNSGKYSYKIYFPLADKKRKWLFNGGSSENIEGFDQLDPFGDFVVLTKSLKDCMCYRLFGINAISLQGEVNKLQKELVDEILKRFNYIIINYDNDNQGIKSAKALEDEYGFKSFVFNDAKDLSDLIKDKGLLYAKKQLEKHLKIKLKINKRYE